MTAILGKRFFRRAAVFGSLLLMHLTSAAIAAGDADEGVSIISCPGELKDVRLSFTTKYTPPRGWGHADVKGIKSKGGAHTALSPVVLGHSVESRNLVCRYGFGSGDHKIRLASIKQTMPKKLECTVAPEFRFHCVVADD